MYHNRILCLMSYSKGIWMPLLLFNHEFLAVLDIDTLGESFCRICMLANQFALNAVDVIAACLICFDMTNAGIDGLVEINHDGNNTLLDGMAINLSRLKLLLMCFRFSLADVR